MPKRELPWFQSKRHYCRWRQWPHASHLLTPTYPVFDNFLCRCWITLRNHVQSEDGLSAIKLRSGDAHKLSSNRLQFGHVGTMRGAHLASIGWRIQNEALPRRVMAGPWLIPSGVYQCSHYGVYSAPIGSSLVLISGLSCKTMFNKELWTSSFPLYSIKPNLRALKRS
jgi:hypothetical protein